jgi:hypothetical protein
VAAAAAVKSGLILFMTLSRLGFQRACKAAITQIICRPGHAKRTLGGDLGGNSVRISPARSSKVATWPPPLTVVSLGVN